VPGEVPAIRLEVTSADVVSFKVGGGPLLEALNTRMGPETSVSAVAKRDLERYYAILADVPLAADEELVAELDAALPADLGPIHAAGRFAPAVLLAVLRDDMRRTAAAVRASDWLEDRGATYAGAFALLDAVERRRRAAERQAEGAS
jgi:hypothetical protein